MRSRSGKGAIWIWKDLVLRAEGQLPNDFSVAQVLQRQAPRTPLVARRHLFQTGTLRFFDVQFFDAPRLILGEVVNLSSEGDGIVILTLPRTEREADDLRGQQGIEGLAIERLGAGKPVVLVIPESSALLSRLARELAASQIVWTSTSELQSDPAARTELSGRIEELEQQLAAEVGRAFDPHRSGWFTGGGRLNIASWRDASSALSELCDVYYEDAPPIRNELLNRRALSTAAARARRSLIEAMILHGDVAQLGFEGNPPEVSMYRSLLEAHGLHCRRAEAWGFGPPKETLRPLWDAIDEFLRDTEVRRRPLSELYGRLRRPPLGIKDGPLPVVVVAALLARDDDVAVYERGSFMPAWTPSHAERLLRSPDGFEVRQCRVDGIRQAVFTRLAGTLHLSSKRAPSLLDVVRGLVRFIAGLTPYARRTLRISPRARDIREALVRAREPAQLMFEDLPVACGCPPFGVSQAQDRHRVDEFVGTLQTGLREVQNAYPALTERACTTLAEHLSLPNVLVDLAAELRSRASALSEVAVDPMLKSFVLRASDDALAPEDLLTSLATQLANKPPPEWADVDEDQFQVRVAHVARAFRSAESLLVGRTGTAGEQELIRLAVARLGYPERDCVLPLRSVDAARIAALRDEILDTVKKAANEAAARIAAVALAAELLIADSEPPHAGKDD